MYPFDAKELMVFDTDFGDIFSFSPKCLLLAIHPLSSISSWLISHRISFSCIVRLSS